MKIYIASHSQELARSVADALAAMGHQIVSSWVYASSFLPTDHYPTEERSRIAKTDADEVILGDALILIAGPDKYTAGKFIELGIALGAGKRVFILGRRENMLCWHPAIMVISDISEVAD